jgi:O-antigen ligase
MRSLKAFKIFFAFAALLFIAKPFFGFGVYTNRVKPNSSHNILVKSFTKRKPESIEEAANNVKHIHQQLTNPPFVLFSIISLLLLTLFPTVFNYLHNVTSKILADIHLALLPSEHTYLLTGKLII